MKYEVGVVYDFPCLESPKSPGAIVDYFDQDKLIARYNVIWSNAKVARGLVTETFYPEENSIEYYQRVTFDLPEDSKELLESGGCLVYEVIFSLDDNFMSVKVSGPSRVPPYQEEYPF